MFISSGPTILAIDTSTDVCSVAIAQKGKKEEIHESTVIAAREHTQRILPMIEKLLAESALTLRQLDAIAIANGPGSFTGLRIGLSVAQGLAYGADLPLVPVSTLMAMAYSAVRRRKISDQKALIVPAIDARMNEIYWSSYSCKKIVASLMGAGNENITDCLAEEHVSTPDVCFDYCQHVSEETIIAVGSGWRYSAAFVKEGVDIDTAFYSTAHDIAELGLVAFSRGEISDPMHLQPTYLRNEISWQKRQRIR